jgi:hypothetical protein
MNRTTMHYIEYGLIFAAIVVSTSWVYIQFQKTNYGKPYQTV